MSTTTPLRSREVQITREFTAGPTPVWTNARTHSLSPDQLVFTYGSLGGTLYAVRFRSIDVYGQVSSWSSATTHTTVAGPDSANLSNAVATVVIDDDGLHVYDGAIFIEDYTGESVLNAAGFAGAWLAFLASGGIYNSQFAAGSTNYIVETEFSGGDTVADYEASLGTDLPYWVVEQVSNGTLQRIADATAPSDFSLEALGTSGTMECIIYQDVPLSGYSYYSVEVLAYTNNTAGNGGVSVDAQYRDATHAAIGSVFNLATETTDIQGSAPIYFRGPLPPAGIGTTQPFTASYLRVRVTLGGLATKYVRLQAITLNPSQHFANLTTYDLDVANDATVTGDLTVVNSSFLGYTETTGLLVDGDLDVVGEVREDHDGEDQTLPPVGSILMWANAAPPTRYRICDGSSLLRSGYAELFDIIGTTFGAADGTHFNLPDMRQRFPLGVAASGTGSTLGGTGGSIDHTHTGPSHTHTGPSHTHTGPSHIHTTGNTVQVTQLGASGTARTTQHTHGDTGAEGTGATGAAGTGATGADGTGNTSAVNPPWMSLYFIIRAL